VRKVRCDLERFTYGWAAPPACTHFLPRKFSAAMNASLVGHRMAEHRITAAKDALRLQLKEEQDRRRQREAQDRTEAVERQAAPIPELIPDHHLVVARLSESEMKNPKLKEIMGPLKNVVNVALPLVQAPALYQARNTLLFEFPYATEVIDFALADLVGRETVHLRPLLIVGEPGGGKSRFARRLGDVLGVAVWRSDASRSDGASFGGTDRRWYSAEPSARPSRNTGPAAQCAAYVVSSRLFCASAISAHQGTDHEGTRFRKTTVTIASAAAFARDNPSAGLKWRTLARY